MEKQLVCIIEDEDDIRELLAYNLQKAGYATLTAEDGKKGLALVQQRKPHLLLLDVMLPGLDGFGVLKALAQKPEIAATPVIMLTAKGEEMDRVVGLELGAADYVVKPFSVRELLLRVRNVLQRHTIEVPNGALEKHGIALHPEAHTAHFNGLPLDITVTEFRLLEYLMRHAGQVCSREQLLNSVWGYQFEGYARTVDTHMRRLRAKLGEAAELLETVRGVGYRFKDK